MRVGNYPTRHLATFINTDFRPTVISYWNPVKFHLVTCTFAV